jgi:predicted glutamine amidotransferase
MCRLYGFRSIIPSQAHRSLVNADNALATQSAQHPDGWGVAYYVDDAPHVTRSSSTALHDNLFKRVSGVVTSQTVVAHIRKATVGEISVLNCHPFQYGRWVFAHNGDIPDFGRCREEVEAQISPKLRRYILGDTDSERVFFLFLSQLERLGPLGSRLGIGPIMNALEETVRTIRRIADTPDAPAPSLLTLLVTDGASMAAIRGGKDLYWSTHKNRCVDSEGCPHYADICEAPTRTGLVNHFIVSSEPVSEDNVWLKFEEGEVIGVDAGMRLSRRTMAVSA